MLNLFQFIRKSKTNVGFSLVELMIVAGMIGGVGLVVTNLTKQSQKTSTKLQFDTDISFALIEINSLLSNPANCVSAFGTTTTPTNIGGKYYTKASGSAPANGYGNAGFEITSYTLTSPAANSGILTIVFKNKEILKGTAGPATISKSINLSIEGALGAVTKCTPSSSLSADLWQKGAGTDIYYSNVSVGVGTPTPAYSFDVSGTNGTDGIIRGTSKVIAKSSGNFGSVSLVTGTNILAGFLEWRVPSVDGAYGNRLGYMGWNANDVALNLENGANFLVSGGDLTLTGDLTAHGYFYNSDFRLKENIRGIEDALGKVKRLRGVEFEWKNKKIGSKKGSKIGFIAQEVEKIFPEAVLTDPKSGLKSIDYASLISPMVEAIKDQQKDLEKAYEKIRNLNDQVSTIDELKTEQAESRAELAKLRTLVCQNNLKAELCH